MGEGETLRYEELSVRGDEEETRGLRYHIQLIMGPACTHRETDTHDTRQHSTRSYMVSLNHAKATFHERVVRSRESVCSMHALNH